MPLGPKLRAAPLTDPLKIVLVEPEIPPNTGAIARTAAATASSLHLVGDLGFRIDEQSVRRAGLDYWPLVDLHRHESTSEFFESQALDRAFFFTAGAVQSVYDVAFRPGDMLVFGRESVGLPSELLDAHAGKTVGIPTLGPVRSLNLATAVSVVVYAALARIGAFEQTFLASDAIGG
ncbi:MAG: TrmH family RNA methyltransferase [Myxococcota bacterium]